MIVERWCGGAAAVLGTGQAARWASDASGGRIAFWVEVEAEAQLLDPRNPTDDRGSPGDDGGEVVQRSGKPAGRVSDQRQADDGHSGREPDRPFAKCRTGPL